MKNTNITFIAVLTIGVLFGTAKESATAVPSCSELGYTKTSESCSGLPTIKCPTDTSMIFCASSCDSVSLGTYEVCTEYCSEDKNVCIAKRDMTCSEAISKNGGTMLADGATISGTKTGKFYLMGDVKSGTSSLTLTQTTFYDAADIPACAKEMGSKVGSLNLSYVYINSYSHFNVKTTIGGVYYSPQGTGWWANFSKDADIKVQFHANSTFVTPLNINFTNSTSDMNFKNDVKIKVFCEYSGSDTSSWNPPACNVSLGGYGADVQYCTVNQGATANVACEVYDELTNEKTCTLLSSSSCY